MTELTSLPVSVRQHIEAAQTLALQNRVPEAQDLIRTAIVELSKTQPRECALLVAGLLGHQGIQCVRSVSKTTTHLVEHKIFGIKFGEDLTQDTDTTVDTIRLTLF